MQKKTQECVVCVDGYILVLFSEQLLNHLNIHRHRLGMYESPPADIN